jgi:hypothetical protein
LPDASTVLCSTFKGNLTAVGQNIQTYSAGNEVWYNKGKLEPITLNTLPLVRSNTNQSYADSVVASNGLVCTVFIDNVPSGGSIVQVPKYVVADSTTGQNIIPPTELTSPAGTVYGAPKVFLLVDYFVVVFAVTVGAVKRLQYLTINSVDGTNVTTPATIGFSYAPGFGNSFDGVVANSNLFLAWNGADLGGALRVSKLTSSLQAATPIVFPGYTADYISVCSDDTVGNADCYITFHNHTSKNGYTVVVSQGLGTLLAPVQTITNQKVVNITSEASAHFCTIFYEVDNQYTGTTINTNYINKVTLSYTNSTTYTINQLGTIVRSVGLASKAFFINKTLYFLAIYSSVYQPTNFLIDENGNVIAKLAYSNAGAYYTSGIPNITVRNNVVYIPYLIKDLIQAVNKNQGISNPDGIYSQTGVNLVTFDFNYIDIATAEVGNNLNISGGIMWAYDGFQAVEQNFNLWPDDIRATPSNTGGSMEAKNYYYQVTYEWSDNQGNIFRSAPSVPLNIDLSGSGVSTNEVTLKIPTLRLTYKTSNPVKIVIYRWSNSQQNYYQITSVQKPLLNDTTVDEVTYVDTQKDSDILGNNLIYTTGGVIENIGPPAVDSMTLFQSRLWAVASENKNVLWFSKQIIDGTPVEMSDLFTIYVAPTIGVNGSTGDITALSTVDDKLIIFKRDAMYYINGAGPDNAGANSQFSEPAFITSTVGCTNQRSIVFMPNGLMFQSDKGIWLLGRDLSTKYIGAAVEKFTTNANVLSALSIPGTNQVRFTLDSGITLVYDYYYGQWGTFTGVPAVTSCLYENLHTFVNGIGQVFQETPGKYIDGSSPVNIAFTTNWYNLAGLQGFERAYFFYILANYISPHTLNIKIAYDYAPSPAQTSVIKPDNYSAPWGAESVWGGGAPWGGSLPLEQWRVFFNNQKCQAFQIIIEELYDPSFGVPPGAGLTISGLDCIVGVKKGYPTIKPAHSVG